MTDKTTTTTIPALLPCPFCGASDPLVTDHPPHKHAIAALPDHPGSATVECPACAIGLIKPTRAEAVAAWNRRAAPSPAPAAELVMDLAYAQRLAHGSPADPDASPAPAAPSAALIDVGPNVAVQDVAEQVERRVNEQGGEATVDEIAALTIEVLWEMQRAAPAQPAQDMTETAKRIAWAYWLSLDTLRPDADRDRAWDHLTEAAKEAWLSAARDAQPVGEVDAPAIAETIEAATRYTKRVGTDFVGRMGEAFGEIEECSDGGEVDADMLGEYRSAVSELAALALAQTIMADEQIAALRSGDGR